MISQLIDFLINFAIAVIEFSTYGGIFFLMLLESCGIPIPSEVIMPFSGFLVQKGLLSFWGIVLVGTLGNLVGSLLAYWIGFFGGRVLIEKFGRYILISKKDLDLADHWFSKYGSATVFFGRLIPIIRTYISFPAGISKMDLKKFSFYTFFGALPWSILFAWLGIKMGQNWELIQKTIHKLDYFIAALIIAAICYFFWHHFKNKNN
jgi:membrane protein DedA with SNARE-associated domain